MPFKLLLLLFPVVGIVIVVAQLDQLPLKTKGEFDGILTAKGDVWIEVKDDDGYLNRYLPNWIGGPPARGGGYDTRMLNEMAEIPIGNRIQLSWHWDGHLRVERLKLLRPFKSKGVVVGTIVNKGEKWIEILSSRNETPSRYYAKWVGGSPSKGGGYDREILSRLGELESGNKVKLVWSYDIRPRVVSLFGVDEDEEAFIPFYEQELNLPEPDPVPPSVPANPFDQVPDAVSPFDQISPPVPAGNPFDLAPSPSPVPVSSAPNPFDAGQAEPSTPSNPFDQKIPANPFDSQSSQVPANPFDG